MRIFPDTSPERPVHLSCDCGERMVLTEPPEDWPIACPVCGKNVRVVDPETVRPPADPGAAPRLLEAPDGTAVPAPRSGAGAPARLSAADFDVPGFVEEGEAVEIESRSFTGKVRREKVVLRRPEAFGAETLALALWIATALALQIGHVLIVGGDTTATTLLVQTALFAAATVGFVIFQRETVGPTLRAEPRIGFYLLLAVSVLPVTVIGVLLYFKLMAYGFGSGIGDPIGEGIRESGASLPVLILAVGILPGFFEELGFRGWMQSLWRETISPGRAIVLSASFFALVHLSPISLGWLLPMGLWLGWLRERSGSIWPGVVAHMGHNTAIVLVLRYLA